MAFAAARSGVVSGWSRCPLRAPGVPGRNEVLSRIEASDSSRSSKGVAEEVWGKLPMSASVESSFYGTVAR
jgi:hypothetical protein